MRKMKDDLRAITVKQLNFYAKSLLDNDRNLRSVTVKGEISGFVLHERSGHAYFTLKDESSSVKTVMFSSSVSALSFYPENGMNVIVRGRVSLYERDGQFQLYAENMTVSGIGDCYLEFLRIKETLEKEGLFSQKQKKAIPVYPESIGLITSPTGAAVHDFLNVTSKRYPCVDLRMYPVNVQGENTVGDIIKALSYFEKNPVDIIVITRGGGSYEDLAVFNSEKLARFVASFEIPIVSAVGHEIDFTILDFVADLRAPTPSAAAETVTPDAEALKTMLSDKEKYMRRILMNRISSDKVKLSYCFKQIDVSGKIRNESIRLDNLFNRTKTSFVKNYENRLSKLKVCSEAINRLNPLAVLSRGFSMSFRNGKQILSVSEIETGEKVTVKLKDGEIDCVAEAIRKNDI